MPTTDERFVSDVAWHLSWPDQRRYQDQLDVLLMGGTVPAEPIRVPNPDCSDCHGEGWVCVCHGFERSYRHARAAGFEKCRCWRPVG